MDEMVFRDLRVRRTGSGERTPPWGRWSANSRLWNARTRRIRSTICGQAPSDNPDFAAFLVEKGIDSVSLSPDAVVPTTLRILEIEKHGAVARA